MKLKMEIVGKITQLKLVEIPGKSPFLDLDIDVVLKTPSGKEYTHWVTCKVWHPLTEKIGPLLSKGCLVSVSGRPEVKPYSRRDGTPAAELIIHAEEIQVLDDGKTVEEEIAA